ncbi:MAG: carbohydrate binding domain-containing protein [Clostridia bacterium]|nr:carbohydrate binding domain-containing protein [Clostridia bacterium]
MKHITKRIISVLFVLCMLCPMGIYAAQAEKADGFLNGDFEELGADGVPADWGYSGIVFGENAEFEKNPYSGERAIRLFGDGNMHLSQTVYGLIPGNEYTFSAFVKVNRAGEPGAMIKLEMYSDPAEGKREFVGDKTQNVSGKGAWKEQSFTFTAPEKAYSASILLRVVGGGDVCYDKASLTGVFDEAELAKSKAPKQDLIQNGSFEEENEDKDGIKGWGLSGTTWDAEASWTNEARTGKKAVRFTSDKTNMFVSQTLYGLVPGARYSLSGWMKSYKSGQPGGMIKLEFYSDPSGMKRLTGDATTEIKKPAEGVWQKFGVSGTVPEDSFYVSVLFRLVGGGDIIWDDTSFVSEFDASKVPSSDYPVIIPDPPYAMLPAAGGELVKNGSFEEEDAEWTFYNPAYCSITDTDAVSGTRALKISTKDGKNPWARQMITDVEPGAQYQISAYIKAKDNNAVGFKVEYYKGDGSVTTENANGSTNSEKYGYTGDNWRLLGHTFYVPKETVSMVIYARLFASKGTMICDDVSVYKVGNAKKYTMETNDVFYYTDDDGFGRASVYANTEEYPELSEVGTAHFALKDGETVLDSAEAGIKNGAASFSFALPLMQEKEKEYTVSLSVMVDGVLQQKQDISVYRYDRPTMMDKEGNFYVDGEIFRPVFAYHVNMDMYDDCAAAGINVVQGENFTGPAGYIDLLDKAHAAGITMLVPLYRSIKPAGHPDNAANTKEVVAAIKDHPALFGYMVIDEPFFNLEEPEEHLENSYKIIREIDKVHPTYIMENQNFIGSVKYCDILGVDIYPNDKEKSTTYIAEMTRSIMHSTEYRKPVWVLLQTFRHVPYYDYFPTSDELRSGIYQSYFCGAKAVGYYCLRDADGKLDLMETPLWEGVEAFGDGEVDALAPYFAEWKYPSFAEKKTDDYWYRSYIKDGIIYVALINRRATAETNATVTLTAQNGELSVGAFTAKTLFGGTETFSGSGEFFVKLAPAAALTIEVTPSETTDFSALITSPFVDFTSSGIRWTELTNGMGTKWSRDIVLLNNDYGWAREAIDSLYKEGIVNSQSPVSYAPGKNITRGDFAMFLVRTLGLTADAVDNFADVSPTAEYAGELAVGRALGVLNGIGENRYNPEAQITRQEMMTIISRALKLSDEGTDLSGYPDANLIADYAVEHVGAMIASGLVKGNADGTINPLGNTTRAEAAVVMQRLCERQQ